MVINWPRAGQWRRLVSYVRRPRSAPGPESPSELLPTRCFGPVGDAEREARLGDVAGGARAPVVYDSR
jgi:hypothetical protein